jgi:hypothetical protein
MNEDWPQKGTKAHKKDYEFTATVPLQFCAFWAFLWLEIQ